MGTLILLMVFIIISIKCICLFYKKKRKGFKRRPRESGFILFIPVILWVLYY
ncbi:hypothetical protein V1512DRAFT_262385 [Lipomyces arxii]|uniref:uncharacterized protein n=1 Tax=Lipomyces arxii TaxID=56418 RepID=UPI0034CF578E